MFTITSKNDYTYLQINLILHKSSKNKNRVENSVSFKLLVKNFKLFLFDIQSIWGYKGYF